MFFEKRFANKAYKLKDDKFAWENCGWSYKKDKQSTMTVYDIQKGHFSITIIYTDSTDYIIFYLRDETGYFNFYSDCGLTSKYRYIKGPWVKDLKKELKKVESHTRQNKFTQDCLNKMRDVNNEVYWKFKYKNMKK